MNNTRITAPSENGSQTTSSQVDTDQRTDCPECAGRVTLQEETGERICTDCGLVLADTEIDNGPEWRSFSDEEGEQKSRVGAPVTELLHDKGLSTTIGWQNQDANGKALSSRKRERIQRLRTWDERYRTKTGRERNLKHAFGEIDRMASALGLPTDVRESAAVLYRRAVENDLLPGRSIEAMSSAALYATARQHNTPRTLSTFETVSRVEKLAIQRAYRYLSHELELAIAPADPVQYLRQYASALNISDEAERLAADILDTAKQQGIHSGKSPAGLAASAVYAAARLTNETLTQDTVSEATDVATVTIRNRYQELLDVYGETGGV